MKKRSQSQNFYDHVCLGLLINQICFVSFLKNKRVEWLIWCPLLPTFSIDILVLLSKVLITWIDNLSNFHHNLGYICPAILFVVSSQECWYHLMCVSCQCWECCFNIQLMMESPFIFALSIPTGNTPRQGRSTVDYRWKRGDFLLMILSASPFLLLYTILLTFSMKGM